MLLLELHSRLDTLFSKDTVAIYVWLSVDLSSFNTSLLLAMVDDQRFKDLLEYLENADDKY